MAVILVVVVVIFVHISAKPIVCANNECTLFAFAVLYRSTAGSLVSSESLGVFGFE